MSRRKIFPSLSSSRQMMMAWNVSGLSQRPAIIASRPASMRLAMAISPSRDNSSTVPISRRYMRTGSSVRSPGSDFLTSVTAFCGDLDQLVVGLVLGLFLGLFLAVGVLGLGDVDAHVGEHRHDVLDLLGRGGVGGQHFVELIEGHEAALLGLLDHLLDGGIGQVEQRRRRVRLNPSQGRPLPCRLFPCPLPAASLPCWPFIAPKTRSCRMRRRARLEILNVTHDAERAAQTFATPDIHARRLFDTL